MVAWLVQPLPLFEPEVIADAIEREFGLSQEDFSVHRHYPKDFCLDFLHQRHRNLVSEARKLKINGLDIHVQPWKLLCHAFGAALCFRVKICPSSSQVASARPKDARSKAGLTFRVLLHLDQVDDFSAAPANGVYDLGGTVVPFWPTSRRLL
ncbi:hypothetical protein ABZP36_011556 [Zizania latifolia]